VSYAKNHYWHRRHAIMQIGPNTTLMGRHYPLDIAAQCEVRATLHSLCEALTHLHPSETVESWPRQRARVRTYASQLIEREETVVRQHENDATIHPSLLEAHMVEQLPRHTMMVTENPTGRTTLLPFGYQDMGYARGGGGSLGWGVGGAIGAKIGVGRERPVVLNIGDGSLTYSAAGFWTMARYNTAVLTIVSNNDSYQVVRQNWAREAPDSLMVREGKYPGIYLNGPATDYVGLARSQGVDGERVTAPQALEAALKRGVERIMRDNQPYLIDVAVAREGVGADSTWYQDWRL
jgi:thiamine pyrophosphate-dependent acetolactate synthase large subunit-like protein